MPEMNQEVRILAGIAAALQSEYSSVEGDWETSPFGWIRKMSSIKVRGTIGEQLVAGWLAARGFNVARATHSDADRIIEKKAMEIKFAMLGQSGSYVFNQFRDQRYDGVICLGVSPFDAHCWLLSKADVMKEWRELRHIKTQHDPQNPNANTGILTVKAHNPPDWFRAYVGTLHDGLTHISRMTGFTPKEPKLG
jgi:hypothetical protein